MTSCCFTGHRSCKLTDCNFDNIETGLKRAITKLIHEGVYTYYTGMAEGIDLLAGRIVSELKYRDPRIKLHAAIPFSGQKNNLSLADQELYNWVQYHCDDVCLLSQAYYPGCFYDRNKYMVDRCEYVLAVYNGKGGGTKHTIDYATSKGKNIVIIDPKEPYSSMGQMTL